MHYLKKVQITDVYGNVINGATEANQINGNQKTQIVDDGGDNLSVNSPLPVDGISVHQKDVWLAESTSANFTDGTVVDLFNNLHSVITNITTDNPKTILVHFRRTLVSNAVGLGAFTGNFSNTKIEIGNSGGIFTTVIDESLIGTKYTSRTFQLPITAGFNALRITFHTADAVTLSNCFILKTTGVVARLQATKPDGTVTDIHATAGSNLKFSLEELENNISANENSQLKVTLFGQRGTPVAVSPTNTLNVNTEVRLVGHSFDGVIKDTSF